MTKLSHELMGALLLSTALSFSASAVSPAQADDPASAGVNMDELYNMPVEKLMGMDYTVTSASKREEKLLDTAAAVYVVSQEDIRRSGATSIPEALREVPGLDVARIDAHTWAISSRGFNGQFSNKLLVMIDGRSIYNQVFSGVFWDEQNIPLENIERIEVVRGPGATLWGANAVNGVINIITKNSEETQGNLVSVATGTIESGMGTVRHGGKFGDDGFYRVYANTMDDDINEPYAGASTNFSSHITHAGFRTDWGQKSDDGFMIEGDMFGGNEHDNNQSPFEPSVYPKGANINGQWTHIFSPASKLQVQSYVDLDHRQYNIANLVNNSYDIDVQHTYTGFDRHEIVWGAGTRFIDLAGYPSDGMGGAPSPYYFTTNNRLLHILNGFAQDQYALVPDKWFLILGSKIEDNSYTGVEIQPSARTLWKIDPSQSVWASVTHAVRTPSAREDYADIRLASIPPGGGNPFPAQIVEEANNNFEAEQLNAYEIGYRKEISKKASVDISTFYNSYGNLASLDAANAPTFNPATFTVTLPVTLANEIHATTYGVEVAPSWQVTDSWSLKGSYSLLVVSVNPNSSTVQLETPALSSPQNQFNVISYLNLPHAVEFDTSLYYTQGLPDMAIPTHFGLNARLGWKPFETDQLELSLTGQNLFNRDHTEMNALLNPTAQTAIPIPQDVIAKATLKF